MDIHDQIANAPGKISRRLPYMAPGNYLLDVLKLDHIKSRKGKWFFVADFLVLESTNKDRPAGTKMSWMSNPEAGDGAGANSIKVFLATLGDIEPDSVDADGSRLAVSAQQPFAGTLIQANAYNIETRAGQDFTVVDWENISEEGQKLRSAAYEAIGLRAA